MKRTIILLFIIAASKCIAARPLDGNGDKKDQPKANYNSDSTWRWGGLISVNFSQVAIGEYWAAGGLSSYSLTSLLRLYSNYKKGKTTFDNNFDMGYGIIKQGEMSSLSSQKWLKSDDKLEANSKIGRQIKDKKISVTALLNFKSQIAPGFNYPDQSKLTSNFLAPGYLVFGGGFDIKPNKGLSIFLAPISSGKITFVNDQALADSGSFGVKPATRSPSGEIISHGSRLRAEFGGFMKVLYKKENLSTNADSPLHDVSFQSNLDLFSNYLNSPQNVDVNWGMTIGMKVNKFITVTVTTNLIYDNDVSFLIEETDSGGNVTGTHHGPRVQFKEVLGVGFSYNF